jgi:hypothetical protein
MSKQNVRGMQWKNKNAIAKQGEKRKEEILN